MTSETLAMNLKSRAHVLIIAVVAVLLLVPALSLGQTGKSGITGLVEQMGHPGPTRSDDRPQYYKGPLEVMRMSDGQLAGTTTSDENGKFTIALAPGKYFITQSDRSYSRIHSEPITVEKGKFTAVKVTADNGMR
jgi:hypothetical protein